VRESFRSPEKKAAERIAAKKATEGEAAEGKLLSRKRHNWVPEKV
jgi:hypothetical protein